MKVIRKEPKRWNAYQWNGYSREDYNEFIKQFQYWMDGVECEYYDNSNKLYIRVDYDGLKPKQLVKERNWIVATQESWVILSEKEFKEQYEVIE